MTTKSLSEDDKKYLLALFTGSALSALLPVYDGMLNPTQLAVRSVSYAQAAVDELDRRLSHGNGSEQR